MHVTPTPILLPGHPPFPFPYTRTCTPAGPHRITPHTLTSHQVGLHNLIKAFHSARTGPYIKLKLAKRGGQPCICLEARVRAAQSPCGIFPFSLDLTRQHSPSLQYNTNQPKAMEVDLLHEIPVRVMRAADIQYYTPPDVPPPQVQLELPYNRVRTRGGRHAFLLTCVF